MNIPKSLKRFDKVGLIAPSGPLPENTAKLGIDAIKKLGFIPVVGKYACENNGYLAGKDEQRAEDFNAMFADKSIKGIICLRGGYGAIRILDKINWDIVKQNPKVFVGYSDITALHIAINQKTSLITYHGPMPTTELIHKKLDKLTFASLKQNIYGKTPKELDLNRYTIKTLIRGSFSGKLVGGNLTTIVSTLGSEYEINTENCILFLEDISEPLYKVDRMLIQLKICGKLKNVSAVILGDFIDENGEKMKEVNEVFKDILQPLGIPCLYNLPCGHSFPTITLPLGTNLTYKENI